MVDVILNGHLGDAPIIHKGVEIKNPFIDYCREDKSKYSKSSSAGYIDPNDDFLLGLSGGLLMNINFVFVNTHLLSPVANHFKKHECYTFAKEGTVEYSNFKRRERKRRIEGFTAPCKLMFEDVKEYFDENTSEARKKELVKPLRITGDHYGFLNYSRIKRSPTEKEKKSLSMHRRNKKITDFPLFLDGQYWNCKLDEFCVLNNFNTCEAKARRKGFTYLKAFRSANIVNLYKDTIVINLGYDESFINKEGAINSFVYKNLQWFEEQTCFSRGFLKEQLSEIKLGYKLSKYGNRQFGQLSTVLGASLRGNTSAGVGKDAVEINFEESGKNPVLDEALGVTLSATEDGGEKIGIIRVFGTGGTKDTNWIQFSDCFYNPAKYEMVKLENVWDKDARANTCGFFYPQMWGYFPFIEDGNSMLLDGYLDDYNRKQEAKKSLTSKDYTVFVGQRANSPEEAFINTLDNLFSSVALSEHLIYIQNNEDLKFYKDGWLDYYDDSLQFLENSKLEKRGYKPKEYITDVPFSIKKDITGAVRIYYPPYKSFNSLNKDNYIIIYDPYGKDKAIKDIVIKNSLACIFVIGLRNSEFPFHEDRICAAYVGRMNTMEESDLLAIRMADYYGGRIVAEMDRGTMLQTAKKFGRMDVMAKDVSSLLEHQDSIKRDSYGVTIGTGDNKLDLLGQMHDWLYQVVSTDEDGKPTYLFQKITDVPFIKELTLYNSVNNFDRVSTYLAGIKHMRYFSLKHYRNAMKNKTSYKTNPRRLGNLLLG